MAIEFDTCLQMFAPRYDSNIQVYQAPDYKPGISPFIAGSNPCYLKNLANVLIDDSLLTFNADNSAF